MVDQANLSESQKSKLKTIAEMWFKEAAQKNIVLIGGVHAEKYDGKWFAVARTNVDPLHTWREPLD